jgi:hypothetical protein
MGEAELTDHNAIGPRAAAECSSRSNHKKSRPTAEHVLKQAAAGAAFDRHLAGLATFRHGLLIRGSLVRTQLGEPLSLVSRTSGGWRLTHRRDRADRRLRTSLRGGVKSATAALC